MPSLTAHTAGEQILREMEEFGNLSAAAQRYIYRSLQVHYGEVEMLVKIARTGKECRSISRQAELYQRVDEVIAAIPTYGNITSVARFMSLIAPLLAFDLSEEKLETFAAFIFLYERLLGPSARPWLPAAFMMIASRPELDPNRRLELLASVSADAIRSHWSTEAPEFIPQWIEELAA